MPRRASSRLGLGAVAVFSRRPLALGQPGVEQGLGRAAVLARVEHIAALGDLVEREAADVGASSSALLGQATVRADPPGDQIDGARELELELVGCPPRVGPAGTTRRRAQEDDRVPRVAGERVDVPAPLLGELPLREPLHRPAQLHQRGVRVHRSVHRAQPVEPLQHPFREAERRLVRPQRQLRDRSRVLCGGGRGGDDRYAQRERQETGMGHATGPEPRGLL